MVWEKRDGWWGTETLSSLDPKPTYIVDIVNSNNATALGLVLQGGMDLSNNFLPGVAGLLSGGYGLSTYYAEPPYMLSANTAWLNMNTHPGTRSTTRPSGGRWRRRSTSRTSSRSSTATSSRRPARPGSCRCGSSGSTRRSWTSWASATTRRRPRQILADAGYTDTDGDGFVENKDGSPITLELIVPTGWTDWMESIRVIATSAQAVGINVQPAFPDYPAYLEQLQNGNFDLAIDNRKNLSNTPWTFYNYLFRLPISDVQLDENFARYDERGGLGIWSQQLDQTPVDDAEGLKAVMSRAPAHPADRPAGHPALVQRRVVAGEQHGLDQLAVRCRPPLPARHLERLLADGRPAHARRARARSAG